MHTDTARIYLLILALCCIVSNSCGQSTGLVLSGGGAKGIAHIGVIKALEENNVRIDYIAGTSSGAIVGALYAMGYTPEEMLDLFKSEDFDRWSTGEIENRYKFSYKNYDHTPTLINIPIVSDKEKTKPKIPSYLIPSQVMDFAFLELTCASNAASGEDFDRLMIPFRCVAADIYNKKQVIFRKGNLAHAVRSSMTYPIYFEPLYVDSLLLFDGGIYNNFPFDVLIDEFDPDFIIGSKVSGQSKKPGKDDLMLQLENMIMQPTNFNIPDSFGIVIDSKFSNIGLLDFHMADSLYRQGYESALLAMPKIIERAGIINDVELKQKREGFIENLPEPKFRDIIIRGVENEQKEYISSILARWQEDISLEQIKEEYFRLVSEENIINAYPEAIFDKDSGVFDLLLDIKLKSAYNLSAGGLLSFTSYNQGFLEFDLYSLTDIYNRFSTNMYFGRYYSSFRLSHRIVIPRRDIIFIDLVLNENRWNYHTNNITSLFDASYPTYIQRRGTTIEAAAGRPINNFTTIKGRVIFGWLRDNYYQDAKFIESSNPDNTQYLAGSFKVQLESNRLNRKQFATSGNYFNASASVNAGYEYFDGGDSDTIITETDRGFGYTWYTMKVSSENFYEISKRFTMGTLFDLTLSNKPYSSNYTSTLINSYSFRPTPFSNLIYGESLRSNSYLGGGLRPLYKINDNLSIRSGIYVFAPFFPLENDGGRIVRGNIFEDYRGVAELGAVFHTPVGPVSIGTNIFSHERRKAYYYLNFGYILFNKSGLD